MILRTAELDKAEAYRLLIGLIVPRPIAWVGSVSAAGVENLAPFSFFMGVSASPPSLALSVARDRRGQRKHTASNILETRDFCVSVVELPDLDVMHASSAEWPGSEFEALHLESAPGSVVAAPRVSRARASLECRLWHHLDLESTDLLIGRVECIHIADELYRDGRFMQEDLAVVARLGGDLYTGLGPIMTRARPPRP